MSYAIVLRERQNLFMRHLAYLILYIQDQTQLTISGGDLWRSATYQKALVAQGVSWTLDSMHLKRLAIDINFFLNDYYLFSSKELYDRDFKLVEPVGAYWESFGDDHVWGGRWTKRDPYHFEMKWTG